MRRGAPILVVFIVILLVVAIAGAWLWGVYNRFVSLDVKTREAWAQVDNVLQRRADLIPNLVATVKGYAAHERSVFTEVTNARAGLLEARTVQEKSAASTQFEKALSRLLLVVENYPQLKASENFLRLQDELAGTENRIAVERMRYNEAVSAYNRAARGLPGRWLVGWFGFDAEKPFFEAAPAGRTPPSVSFE